MNAIELWISEHFALFLIGALLAALAILAFGIRSLVGSLRGSRSRGQRIFAAALSLVAVLIGGAATLFLGSGIVETFPPMLAQRRMLDQPAPALEFRHVDDDRSGRLADYRGQVVLLNVWATWCPPCREEMPDLQRLQEEYADEGLVVLQISDEERATVARYLESRPMTTVHGYAEPIPWPEFGRPTTFLVDREGVLRRAIVGARKYEQFEREIAELL
jgi:thiol-disulfide isomerase/thioredoxin